MAHERYFHLTIARPTCSEEMDAHRDVLCRMVADWVEKYGYTVLTTFWDYHDVFTERRVPMVELRVIVQLAPRWDGVWGDLRAALVEDGLLPSEDLDPWRRRPVVAVDPASGGDGEWVTVGYSYGPFTTKAAAEIYAEAAKVDPWPTEV